MRLHNAIRVGAGQKYGKGHLAQYGIPPLAVHIAAIRSKTIGSVLLHCMPCLLCVQGEYLLDPKSVAAFRAQLKGKAERMEVCLFVGMPNKSCFLLGASSR